MVPDNDAGALPVLDMEDALERLAGDLDLLKEMLELFLDYYPEQLEGLREACQRADAEALMANAHSLKGAAANVGATRTSALCKDLELMGRESRLEPATGTVALLEAELEALREQIVIRGLVETA